MNYTKRKDIVGFTAFFLVFIFLSVFVSANALDIQTSSNPAYLTEAGSVNIILKIENASDQAVKDLTLVTHSGERSIGQIEPKQIISVTANDIFIAEEDFDSPPIWSLNWREGDENFSQDFPLPISKNKGEAKILITSSISREVIRAGEDVEISYTVKNEGDFELSGITVTDEAVEGVVKQGFSLAPGESDKITTNIKPSVTTVSVAKVKAAAPDGSEVTDGTAKKEIAVASEGLNIALSEKSRGDGKITFDVNLINQGTVELSSIKLMNEEGVLIQEGIVLASNEEGHYEYIVDDKGEMEIIVEALYVAAALGEEEQSVSSTPYSVETLYKPEEISLSGKALLPTPELDKPGPMSVKLELENNSPIELKNLVIKEELAGTLFQLDVMQPGMQIIDVEIEVTQSRDLSFSVTYEDVDSRPYTSALAPVSVVVKDPVLVVSDVNVQDEAEQNEWMIYLMVGLVALALIVVISIIGMLIKRAQAPEIADDLNAHLLDNPKNNSDNANANNKKANKQRAVNKKAQDVIKQSNTILNAKETDKKPTYAPNKNKAKSNKNPLANSNQSESENTPIQKNASESQKTKLSVKKTPPVIPDYKTPASGNSGRENRVPPKGQIKLSSNRDLSVQERARRANINAEMEYKESLERIRENANRARRTAKINETNANEKAEARQNNSTNKKNISSGTVGSEPVGSGSVGSNPVGAGSTGSNPVGAGSVGTGTVGSLMNAKKSGRSAADIQSDARQNPQQVNLRDTRIKKPESESNNARNIKVQNDSVVNRVDVHAGETANKQSVDMSKNTLQDSVIKSEPSKPRTRVEKRESIVQESPKSNEISLEEEIAVLKKDIRRETLSTPEKVKENEDIRRGTPSTPEKVRENEDIRRETLSTPEKVRENEDIRRETLSTPEKVRENEDIRRETLSMPEKVRESEDQKDQVGKPSSLDDLFAEEFLD